MRGKKYIQLIGKTVNYLTILSFDHVGDRAFFNCKCICGKMVRAYASNVLKRNHTMSCGCFKSEIVSIVNITHGLIETREYSVWSNIKTRCTNKNNPAYHRYGGRGIKICDRWAASFEDFLLDVGLCPSKDHSLDRKNNNGNYEPGNVRWSTRKEQGNNRRSNRMIDYNGKTQTLAQWCDELKMPYGRVSARIYSGWPIHHAFTVKLFAKIKYVTDIDEKLSEA